MELRPFIAMVFVDHEGDHITGVTVLDPETREPVSNILTGLTWKEWQRLDTERDPNIHVVYEFS